MLFYLIFNFPKFGVKLSFIACLRWGRGLAVCFCFFLFLFLFFLVLFFFIFFIIILEPKWVRKMKVGKMGKKEKGRGVNTSLVRFAGDFFGVGFFGEGFLGEDFVAEVVVVVVEVVVEVEVVVVVVVVDLKPPPNFVVIACWSSHLNKTITI
jgi:hypothetical protein